MKMIIRSIRLITKMNSFITSLSLAVLFVTAQLSQAEVYHSQVLKDERVIIPLSQGEISWTLSSASIDKNANLDKMGVFVVADEYDVELEQGQLMLQNGSYWCPLDALDVGDSFIRFSDSAIKTVLNNHTSYTATFIIEDAVMAYLYFANCDAPDSLVSFDMHIEEYNWDVMGHKNYLSVGEMEEETLYWVMFSLFTSCTLFWGWYVWRCRAHAHRIHYLMGLLVLLKAFTVMSQALDVHYVARTGAADGWNVVYYIFTALRSVLFFVVIILIGTGWSYMKPFLGERDKRILMVVIPLQVLANMAIIIVDETSPAERDWFTWLNIFHLVDIICCCAILFPIVWSIKNLREAAHTDGKAARNLEKLTLFRQFYIIVVVYIYFTRIIVYLLENILPYQYTWIAEAADQLATLAFYVWTAVSFSPTETNPYLKLRTIDEEIEASEIELEQSRLL